MAENELLTPTRLRVRPMNAMTPATDANVQVLPTQPEADGHSALEGGHNSAVRSERAEHITSLHGFFEAIRLPLQEPVLLTTPRAHVPRGRDNGSLEDQAWLPRRSSRLAAKSAFRDPNPERQAKRIMISRWTGNAAGHVADQDVDDEFRAAFEAASLSARKEAMAAMFPRRGSRTQPARSTLVTQ